MFHQRNKMPPQEVAIGRAMAATQEELILGFFRSRPELKLTPPQVHECIPPLRNSPLTSIRRALTNLTTQGMLRKNVDEQKPGKFGMHNCTWQLAEPKQGRLFE